MLGFHVLWEASKETLQGTTQQALAELVPPAINPVVLIDVRVDPSCRTLLCLYGGAGQRLITIILILRAHIANQKNA